MGIVIAANNGALSNLIKCIISCLRIKSIYKHYDNIQIIWMQNPKKVSCDFKDLFENEYDVKRLNWRQWLHYHRNVVSISDYVYTTSRLYIDSKDNINPGFSSLKRDVTGLIYKDFNATQGKVIDHEYNRIPKELQKTYRFFLKQLIIKNDIIKIANDFLITNNLHNNTFTAVHARTWNFTSLDHTPREKMRRQTINLEKILNNILSIKTPIFLCSDDNELIDMVLKEKKDTIVRHIENKGNPNAVEGLVDILIASKAKTLYLTLHSTFSEMIWWYNENNPEVYFI